MSLSSEQIKQFHEEGFLRLDASPLRATLDVVRAEVSKLVSLRSGISNTAVPAGSGDDFDRGLIEMAKADRQNASAVFDAASRTLSLHQLSIHPWLIGISQDLMSTDFVQCALDKALRMDLPEEEKFLFPFHQDYTYDPSSPDGVVFWIPLKKVTKTSGAISIMPRSHKAGVRDIVVKHGDNSQVTGNQLFELSDLTDIDDEQLECAELDFGEIVVFSNLLIHASRPNLSDSIRWTVQVRHGNFCHPTAINKGWPHGNFRGKWFYQTHPEKIVQGTDRLE